MIAKCSILPGLRHGCLGRDLHSTVCVERKLIGALVRCLGDQFCRNVVCAEVEATVRIERAHGVQPLSKLSCSEGDEHNGRERRLSAAEKPDAPRKLYSRDCN